MLNYIYFISVNIKYFKEFFMNINTKEEIKGKMSFFLFFKYSNIDLNFVYSIDNNVTSQEYKENFDFEYYSWKDNFGIFKLENNEAKYIKNILL